MGTRRRTLSAAVAVLLVAGLGSSVARADAMLLNVSYDPTRELHKELSAAFAEEWKAKTGETVSFKTSHGGSSKQARAVIDGLDADIVTLALSADIDAIAERTGKIPADWQKRLPHNSSPYTSTINFLVRKGNPKNIKGWDDLIRSDVQVITPNPKTSGGARWNYLAAWGYALEKFNGDESKVREFVGAIYKNVPVLDTGARGSTTTFAQRGLGDVLIAWENEAFLAINELGPEKFDVVTPPVSILAEPPVALVDGNVDAKGTRKVAEGFLEFMYTPKGQAIIAKHYYRPVLPEHATPEDLARFPEVRLFDIASLGGWKKLQPLHFADGGVFDQIYKPGT
jgi:sulfate/thiosulfate transport system substrate-binding protein